MRILRTTGLLIALAGMALWTGCISVGGLGPDGVSVRFYRSDSGVRNVEGTVERVDTANRRIVLAETPEPPAPGNVERGEPAGREIAIYYDDDTVVVHEGQNYRPEDLQPGDLVHAEAEITREGLTVEQIDVLAVGNGGGAPESSTQPAPDDRRQAPPLRGTVRFVDTRAHTLEIETPSEDGRPDLVEVFYDGETVVEYQGRRYSPETLERGDPVEIDARSVGSQGRRLLAEHIVVLGEGETKDH
jgi:hypothetical protein